MDSRYMQSEISNIFDAKKSYWLRVEQAHLQTLSGAELVEGADLSFWRDLVLPDSDELELMEATTRHDVEAFVRCLVRQVSDEQGRWIHYGLTSSDVVDTANAMMLRDAARAVLDAMDGVASASWDALHEYEDIPVMARTHGVPAEVTTFGRKFGRFAERLDRAWDTLARAQQAVAVGKISGAVGTYSVLPPAVEHLVLQSLGLGWHQHVSQIVPRDLYTRLGFALADVMAALESIAMEVRLGHQPEIGTMAEGFAPGQTGSSAMPHKKNPIKSERICGLSRYVRGQVPVLMENEVSLWNERDISHSSVERFVIPDMFHVVLFSLREMDDILRNLAITDKTAVFTGSASQLARYLKTMPRDEAYAKVQAQAFAGNSFSVDPSVELSNLDK